MSDGCPYCGENSLSWEDYGNFHGDCSGSCVCTSCGAVVDESNLTAEEAVQRGGGQCSATNGFHQPSARERKQFNIRSGASSMTKGRRIGLDLTKRIAQYLDCKSGMTTEAVELYERIFAHDNFRTRYIVTKRALAACSVYIICRQHSWPVMLSDVCGMVGSTIYAVNSWKKRIIATFPELGNIRGPDVFELIDARCKKAGISGDVHRIAIGIAKLCRDLWLSEGRKPDNVVITALYVAWQSEDPSSRLKVKIRDFCRQYQLAFSTQMTSLLHDMRGTLCQLAKNIPWVLTDGVTDADIALHVRDVIAYRSTLIAEARADILRIAATVTEDPTAEICDIKCDSPELSTVPAVHTESDNVTDTSKVERNDTDNPDPDDIEKNNVQEKSSQMENCNLSESGTVACASKPCVTESITSENSSYRMALGQEYADIYRPFWPPRGYKPYKRINVENPKTLEKIASHPDLNSAMLSKYDIPEEDMHLYFKSAV